MIFRKYYDKVVTVTRSRRGHDFLVFLAFLCVSTILWCVMTLNDEDQCDVRMPFELTNVPDSVTLINEPPSIVAVSLRAQGAQRLKLAFTNPPTLSADFRLFRGRDVLKLTNTDMKALARNALGGATVVFLSPDSLTINYTTSAGRMLPVAVDYSVATGPKSVLVGEPSLSFDSVRVFSQARFNMRAKKVLTQPINLSGINETTTRRVALVAPAGSRVIPDSVDVTFKVEPLILKSRKVAIETVNVPNGMRLITFPATVNVRYLISQSDYVNKNFEPKMRVVADYATIDQSGATRNMRLRLRDVSAGLQNVQLEADSVEFIIERL